MIADEPKQPPWPERPPTIPDEQRAPKLPSGSPSGPPWSERPRTIEEVQKGGRDLPQPLDPNIIRKA